MYICKHRPIWYFVNYCAIYCNSTTKYDYLSANRVIITYLRIKLFVIKLSLYRQTVCSYINDQSIVSAGRREWPRTLHNRSSELPATALVDITTSSTSSWSYTYFLCKYVHRNSTMIYNNWDSRYTSEITLRM